MRQNKTPKPPPMYLYRVINYQNVINHIKNHLDQQDTTKSMADNIVKINCNILEIYRKLVRFFKVENLEYRTYHLKEERAYGVMIK